MQIRQLQMFQYAMIYGSISEASKAMNISQPSGSRLIADLEQSVGFSLFIRANGRITPSPEGIMFFEKVRKTFSVLEDLERYAEQIKKQRSGSLRIAVSPALSMNFTPKIVKLFKKIYPNARIELVSHSPDMIFDLLHSEEIDLAFLNKMVLVSDITEEILIGANFICAIPKNHRLASKDIIIPSDLEGEDFIDLANIGTLIWTKHRDMFQKYNVNPSVQYTTQSTAFAYGMVEEGLGIGILDPFSYPSWKGENIVIKPFLPKLTYTYAAYYLANHIRSEFARAFVECAKKHLNENLLPFADFYNEN